MIEFFSTWKLHASQNSDMWIQWNLVTTNSMSVEYDLKITIFFYITKTQGHNGPKWWESWNSQLWYIYITLVSSDFWWLLELKEMLKGQHFSCDADVAVCYWRKTRKLTRNFLQRLKKKKKEKQIEHLEKWVDQNGDHFEKKIFINLKVVL